jgi:hypothetical protein
MTTPNNGNRERDLFEAALDIASAELRRPVIGAAACAPLACCRTFGRLCLLRFLLFPSKSTQLYQTKNSTWKG